MRKPSENTADLHICVMPRPEALAILLLDNLPDLLAPEVLHVYFGAAVAD